MLLVRAETRMAGVRIRFSCNSLLWHWVIFIVSVRCLVGCLALVSGLTLFSCGGSKPAEPTPAASEEKPVKVAPSSVDTRPAVVAFGNSLTAGFGAEPGNSYPDFLQTDLDSAGLRWRVINAGVSGDTTTDGVNRL